MGQINQHELLLQLSSHSWSTQDQFERHWLHCPQCHPHDCPVGQRLAQAAHQAFKAWDELDTQINFPELVKKEGVA